MLKSKSKWEFLNEADEPSQLSDYSPITKQLLAQRGITTEEAAKQFITPDLVGLNHPKDLSMIDKAVERVHQAITNEEKILVFGDYDADGVSSTALLLKALQELGAHYDFYIPNRFTEGYGPNETAFRKAYDQEFKVIITVDTGITAVHEAEVAKELGIDLIVTDHHELQDELPNTYATINPKCSPDYPFQELAGVGVAFKFAEHLLGYFPEQLLDLVAIGTIADLVPLVDENRILAYFGLRKLTTTTNLGLRALKKVCKVEGNVTEENVGFLLGPRINAVGRLQDAGLAVELLMTEDEDEATEIAHMIQSINEERQQIVSEIVEEAEHMITSTDEKSVLMIAKEGWNEGVLGIVASRLVRKYDRPAIVLSIKPETGEIKGSARSIPAFNLFENCMAIRELFTKFGGHSQAAGMTFPSDNLEEIQSKLNDFIRDQLTIEDFTQVIEVNQTLSIEDVHEKLVDEINQLAPFGMGNPKPIFHINDIPTDARQIGHLKNHLKLQFKDDDIEVEGIGFGIGHLYAHISPHTPLSIIGELGINEWNGIRKPQMIIQDMGIKEWQLFDQRGRRKTDITPYLFDHGHHVVLCKDTSQLPQKVLDHVGQITYETNVSTLGKVDHLFIYDLPTDLSHLIDIIHMTTPENIHACFYVENSMYLKAFPTREDFKWFYALVVKRKSIDMKRELTSIIQAKNWTKERIIFIAKVFAELGFVNIDHGVVALVPNPAKKELQDSILYQNRLKQEEVEKVLYYSNYEELRRWFEKDMGHIDVSEEEIVHGL